MKANAALLLLTFAGVWGCSHQPPPPAHHEYARGYRGDWTKLGERSVDGLHDRDVIWVGAHQGPYRRIMIVVERSPVEMFDVVVKFGDGTEFSPATRHVFGPDTRSHVIDLPGRERIIRSVEFRYGNLPGGGRAETELWAQR